MNDENQANAVKEWKCEVCGYIYPTDGNLGEGITPETPFEELPDEWVCPLCQAGKDSFIPVE